ncbi:alpha/beta hydrolase [Alteromonas sp. ASW11-36]|uniref:Alpha/beta hydrolase n=1 Tax=Alteromonas arenosi TaxID=3055817 RepID=A0ABT7SY72_9ALTE|nr:alpha/beta hydrolase [Alteromonas sp. ASW11-36]MDM7861148.1 alpha/beta hydrolase [Alteromonas sp. ASW11-36]
MFNIINSILLWFFLSFLFGNSARAESDYYEVDQIISTETVSIGGSLTIPNDRKIGSLVIMLSGSGPQDRDETLDGFKIFKKLSQQLGGFGISSFRFDDRGVGESTGNFPGSTLEDHVHDVEAIISYFKAHKTYEFNKFILLGHSQGGIVAANIAAENQDIAKVILMGAPAVPLVEVVTYQLREEYEDLDIDKDIVEEEVSAHNKLMASISAGKNEEHALRQFIGATTASLRATAPEQKDEVAIQKLAKSMAEEFKIIYGLPSLTSFLYHDTAVDYSKLSVPVLALFGGKDLQVTIEQNKDRMENALLKSAATYKFVTFKDANHYFQKANTGQREEYATLEKRFVDGFAGTIAKWILTTER